MKELKELVQTTLGLAVYLVAMLIWCIAFLACIALVISLPIIIVAGIYGLVCVVCHMAFSWDFPIGMGIVFLVIFGFTCLDQKISG